MNFFRPVVRMPKYEVSVRFSEEEVVPNGDRVERPRPTLLKPQSLAVVKSIEELNVLDEDDSDCCLQCFNVPLRHGINEYNLTTQVSSYVAVM